MPMPNSTQTTTVRMMPLKCRTISTILDLQPHNQVWKLFGGIKWDPLSQLLLEDLLQLTCVYDKSSVVTVGSAGAVDSWSYATNGEQFFFRQESVDESLLFSSASLPTQVYDAAFTDYFVKFLAFD